jgi:hypothetical protein
VRAATSCTLAAVAALVVSAGCGSSSSGTPAPQAAATSAAATTQAAATTIAPAAKETFTSGTYHFRVTLTEDWSAADALVDWNGGALQGIDSPTFARFTNDSIGRTLLVAAARTPKGTTLAEWRDAMVRAAPGACAESPSASKTTFGGEPALQWTATCSDGYDVIKLTTLHGKWGYVLLLPSVTSNDDAKDQALFESIRRSFRFTG